MSAEPETAEYEVIAPSVALEQADAGRQHSDTIDRLTEGVLSTPGIPGRDEFLNLCLQAKLLSMSNAMPKDVRGNPHLCLHLVLLGRDFGVSPTTAAQMIDFIPDGRGGGQWSVSPEFKCARINERKLGRVVVIESDREHAVAVALEPGGYVKRDIDGNVTEIVGEFGERGYFDWEAAQNAGLAGKSCKPGEHKTGSDNKCPCHQGFKTYPQRMMKWRAKGYCASDNFPEANLGTYSAEELGADVDDQGRMIDPGSVAVPAGFEPVERPLPPGEQPVSDADRAFLHMDIVCLDDEGRRVLRERFARANLPKIGSPEFSDGNLRMARSLLRGVEGERAKAGWDKTAAVAALHDFLSTGEIAATPTPPEPADTAPAAPESAAGDPDPQPDPVTPQEPLTAADSPARSVQTVEPGPALADVPVAAEYPDNDHRGRLDNLLRDHGPVKMNETLAGQPRTALLNQLHARGVERISTEWDDNILRSLLGSIVIRNQLADAAKTPDGAPF